MPGSTSSTASHLEISKFTFPLVSELMAELSLDNFRDIPPGAGASEISDDSVAIDAATPFLPLDCHFGTRGAGLWDRGIWATSSRHQLITHLRVVSRRDSKLIGLFVHQCGKPLSLSTFRHTTEMDRWRSTQTSASSA